MSDEDRDEHDYEMRRPQFERVLDVHSRADQRDGSSHTEHGDPVRWGSTSDITIVGGGITTYTEQVIRVDRETPYPCNWQLIGTLGVPADFASSPTQDLQWGAALELIMGTGQSRMTHVVNLRALIDLANPPALLVTGQSYYFPFGNVFPWVLPGGIVGKSIQMRALFFADGEGLTLPAKVSFTAAISPFNAGDKA